MSENGGNNVRNTLTLEVGQFENSLKNVVGKLNDLDSKLDKSAKMSEKLEQSMNGLHGNISGVNSQFSVLGKSLGSVLNNLNGVVTVSNKATRTNQRLSESTRQLNKQTDKAVSLSDRLNRFTESYDRKLVGLQKTTKSVTQAQKQHTLSVAELARMQESAAAKAVRSSSKALQSTVGDNAKIVKSHKESLAEINRLKREAEAKLASAQTELNKRYFGRNANSQSPQAQALRENIALAKAELNAVTETQSRVNGVVAGLMRQNDKLKQGADLADRQNKSVEAQIALRQRLLQIKNQENDATKRGIDLQQKQINSKNFVGPQPANHLSHILSYGERQRQSQAIANYQNSKSFIGPQVASRTAGALSYGAQQRLLSQESKQQQQNHDQHMRQLREQAKQREFDHKQQMSFAKELAAMYATVKVNQGIFGAVHKNSELEQAQYRLGLWNLPDDEETRFNDKAKQLTIQEKYLTHAESLDARLDAMAAMGGNHEKTIDGTIATATRVAHILRATGNETGSNSDLVKNAYGFAEARQVMNSQEEINKSFETLLKISEISNGKIKVADIETVARNMGSMRADVSADGWLGVAALAEQFKTAGGGNGGGGGVATVGNMLKMMGLYGSGKTITNRAVENLYGADLLNDFDGGDAEKNFRDNDKRIKDFTRMMKNAGFKDTKSMGEDPVKFFGNLRGQILDSMMKEDNFAKYFGEGTERWTYNDKGQMLNKQQQVVDSTEQNKTEQAGFTRWAAQMGWSNRMVDGMVTMLNKNFIDRANEVVESGKRAADSKQALAEAQATLKGNVDNLEASMGRLAESFAPLLPLVTGAVGGLTALTSGIASLMEMHPAIAIVTGLGVAVGGVTLAATVFLGKASILRTAVGGIISAFGGAGAAATTTAGTIGTVGVSSLGAAAKTATAGTRILGVLGGILKWAGWIGLAGMMGGVILQWIASTNKEGKGLEASFAQLMNGLSGLFDQVVISMKSGWVSLMTKLGADMDWIQKRQQSINEDNRKLYEHETGRKYQKADMSPLEATQKVEYGADVSNLAWEIRKLRAKESNVPEKAVKLPDGSWTTTGGKQTLNEQDKIRLKSLEAQLGSKGYSYDVNAQKVKRGAVAASTPSASPPKIGSVLPTPSSLADYSSPSTPLTARSSQSDGQTKEERKWNNPFYASINDLISRTQGQIHVGEELGKAPDYDEQARLEFIRKWTAGDFDPSKDPRSRMFTKGAFDESKGGWSVDQIDWSGMDDSGYGVQDWLKKDSHRRMSDDVFKGIRHAAERVGTSQQSVLDVFENRQAGVDVESSQTSALKRQFARQEMKTPIIKDSKAYNGYKLDAITNQAIVDYGNYANESRKISDQLQIDLMNSEVDKRKASAQFAYDEEKKKINALRLAIDEQIAEYERLGKQDSNSYRAALDAKQLMESEFTRRLAMENEKRVRASESAIRAMVRQYDDLKSNMENIGKSVMEKTVGGIKDLVTGKLSFDEIDWKQFGSDIAGDIAGAMTEKAFAGIFKDAMGEADPMAMIGSIFKGEEATGGGWIAGMLNKARGIGETPVAIEAGEVAQTAETMGLFDLVRGKLEPLATGLGNLWSSVNDASGGLLQFAGDAIVKAISAIGTWASSLLASSAAGGGDSGAGGIISGLVSAGMAMFGGGGGGDMSSFAGVAASTGMTSGQVTDFGLQFAKGGAFTNGLYDSPTPFMFANGGAFGNLGVMGEAGPEAVMPLTRDSSGRLGVQATNMGGGISNQVAISITVNKDGSATQSSKGDDSQDWNKIANSVRALVVQELVNQSRPGGINQKK